MKDSQEPGKQETIRCRCGEELPPDVSHCPVCCRPVSPESPLPPPKNENRELFEADSPRLLITVNTSMEGDLLQALLTDAGIPAILHYQQAGAYLRTFMGTTSFGVDVMVPSSKFEEAQRLLSETGLGENLPLPEDSEDVDDNDMEAGKSKSKLRILLWIFLGAAVIYIYLNGGVSFLLRMLTP